jgi:PKHD-type hydroxylase
MQYNWKLLSNVPKKKLKKSPSELLVENNSYVLPQAIPKFLTSSECDKILKLSEGLLLHSGTVGDIGVADLRNSKIKWLFPDPETDWLFAKLDELALQANRIYQFDLLGFFQGVQIATYAEGGHYGWHIDIGMGKQSNRKLAISVQLSPSDDYEGGDLEFMGIQQKAPKDRGMAIVFPSYLFHRVNPVTKGCRQSLVSWISGNPFR